MSILRAGFLATGFVCRRTEAASPYSTGFAMTSVAQQHFCIGGASSSYQSWSRLCGRVQPVVRNSHFSASSSLWSSIGSHEERNRRALMSRVLSPAAWPAFTEGERPCRVGGAEFRRWSGHELSASSCLEDISDQRRYATGARNHLPPSACFYTAGRRGTRIRGTEKESYRHISSPKRGGGAFAEHGQSNGVGAPPLTNLENDTFKEVEIERTKKLLTLPTVLTLARVAAVPAILAVFYSDKPWATSASAMIFILAAVTDWLDGYLARKMGTTSAFGAFLDPVADKLMVAAALVLLCTRPMASADLATIPWLLPIPTIAIIGREITMSAVREWAAAQGGDLHKAVAVSSLGKVKTASQMISITLLLLSGEGGLNSPLVGVVGVGLLYLAAFIGLWSLAKYMRGIWGSMLK